MDNNSTTELQLTQDRTSTIDSLDSDLAVYQWAVTDRGYAHSNIAKKLQALHRIVLARKIGRPLVKGEQADHINGLKLDNRRSNLRVATHTQNQQNSKRPTTNKSGYKGVSQRKGSDRWVAHIRNNGPTKYLGTFDTPKAAHLAYCKAAKELHGAYANTGQEPE